MQVWRIASARATTGGAELCVADALKGGEVPLDGRILGRRKYSFTFGVQTQENIDQQRHSNHSR